MIAHRLEKLVSTRLPTEDGQFRLSLYRSLDGCDHVMLVHGDVRGQQGVLTRIHSECFTGDVLGSLRCDCGAQLEASLGLIAQAGRGVLLYLRQEGRGIGLADKLRAYNLQDQGYDTVDANAQLGHEPDAREYTDAVLMLRDLGVDSVDLITNNPSKIQALEEMGLRVRTRIPTKLAVNPENRAYLDTKVQRMNHLLQLENDPLDEWLHRQALPSDRPHVTVSYAQSLDGSIAGQHEASDESQLMAHRLRRWHDGVLVGIGTVLQDDPRLTPTPVRIVADSRLRLPLEASLWSNPGGLLIAGGVDADPGKRRALEEKGAVVLELPRNGGYGVDLTALLRALYQRGIRRLLVEGGTTVLNAFLRERLAHAAVVRIAPRLVGGRSGLSPAEGPRLVEPVWHRSGQDMVCWASLAW